MARAVPALLTCVFALMLWAPQGARAAVDCDFSDGDMSVSATAGFAVTMIRNGTAIEARVADVAVPCGSPTTTNTDRILLDDDSASTTNTTARIDLAGGPFAPGDTAESGDTDEIEFDVQDFEVLAIDGTSAGDSWRAGAAGLNLNVNAEALVIPLDVDVDVALEDIERLDFNAVSGNDAVGGQGGSATGAPTAIRMVVRGESGLDTLTGGSGNDIVGDNAGESGNDDLSGGAGSDTLHARAGNDTVDGGTGTDTASYFGLVGVAVSLAESAPQDTGGGGIDELSMVENLTGGLASDSLSGDDGPNVIAGRDDSDIIDGGGGPDVLMGDGGPDGGLSDSGADLLLIRDGSGDSAACGPLADSVVADHAGLDSIDPDCETVSLDTVELEARVRKRQRLARRVRLRAECPLEDCQVVVRAIVRVPGGGARASARVPLKPVRRSLEAGQSRRLSLKLGPRIRRLLAGRRKTRARVDISAADALGSTTAASFRVRLRR